MFLGGGMKLFLCCSTLQQQPAEITMASWAGTWIASLFIFVPWITGQVLIQLWRRPLIFGCSELDGFFALGASLTAWLADGALAHDFVMQLLDQCFAFYSGVLWCCTELPRTHVHSATVPSTLILCRSCENVVGPLLCMQVTGSALRLDWFTCLCPVPSGSSALCNMHMSEQSDHMHAMFSSRHVHFKLP